MRYDGTYDQDPRFTDADGNVNVLAVTEALNHTFPNPDPARVVMGHKKWSELLAEWRGERPHRPIAYIKLDNGRFGLRSAQPLTPGASVTVTTAKGKTKTEIVGRIVRREGDITITTIGSD